MTGDKAKQVDSAGKRETRTVDRLLIKLGLIGVALVSVLSLLTWVSRDYLAIALTPAKISTRSRSQAAIDADKLFWQTFHTGNYNGIERALEVVTAAYLQTPGDAITASHVGWLHIWRVSERARLVAPPSTITDDVILARRYFEESVRLAPHDARTQGFLASAMLAEGQVQGDERLTRRGYFAMHAAVRAWPAFNLFTAGYVLSSQPVQSREFREALDDQWQNLETCVGQRIDRFRPDIAQYIGKIKDRRACLNTPIAPHNVEGFFLNMGDMLVKSGEWQLATVVYEDARLSPQFQSWPFIAVLNDRIRNAQRNVTPFSMGAAGGPPLMVNSAFSCMACHEN